MVYEYKDEEKEFLDDACGRLRITTVGTRIQEIQKAINNNENIKIK